MRDKQHGFTLVEAVLAVLVIGVGLFGVMNLFQGSVSSSFTTDRAIQATQLARERLERLTFDKKMFGYDYVNSANYPAIENFTGDYAPFSRTITIQEVRASDLSTLENRSGYKRVNVSVAWPGGNNVSLETLLTKWNE